MRARTGSRSFCAPPTLHPCSGQLLQALQGRRLRGRRTPPRDPQHADMLEVAPVARECPGRRCHRWPQQRRQPWQQIEGAQRALQRPVQDVPPLALLHCLVPASLHCRPWGRSLPGQALHPRVPLMAWQLRCQRQACWHPSPVMRTSSRRHLLILALNRLVRASPGRCTPPAVEMEHMVAKQPPQSEAAGTAHIVTCKHRQGL